MSLNEFLIWLANSGGSILCVSWLLEKCAWYQTKSAQMKQNLFFGFSFLTSLVAYLVLTYVPAEILNQIAPFFGLMYATFVSVFLGSKFHQETKAVR